MVHACVIRSTTCCYSWRTCCGCCGGKDEEKAVATSKPSWRNSTAQQAETVRGADSVLPIRAQDDSIQEQVREINQNIKMIKRLIESKGINEVTASYALHNAHDAVGNKLPTAAQVTLEQISGFQARTQQQLQQIANQLQKLESSLPRGKD
mmetsp:Transcript_71428/g.190777  ORF Transcript_71428/g.190777 Transcript_71428/m.190777 type:complete len:151 (-) Transcript_71428:101-553(-)